MLCVFFFCLLGCLVACLLCAMAVVAFGGKLLENPIRTKLFIEGLSRQDDGCLMLGYFVSSLSFFKQIFYLCLFRFGDAGKGMSFFFLNVRLKKYIQ